MKRIILSCTLIFIFLTLACSSSTTVQNDNPTGERANSQNGKANDERTRKLRNQIEQIASAAKGRVGAAAKVLQTGESVSFNADEHFPMQSVYKLPIGMAVLKQVDAGKLSLEERVRVEKNDFVGLKQHSPVRDKNPNGVELSVGELLRLAMSESDGTASDVLLKLVGGTEAVGKYLNEIKVDEVIVANTEKEIGQDRETQYRNWASPNGAIALLGALRDRRGLSERSQALLLKLLTETASGPKRLKGLLPVGSILAHKTGTSGTADGVTAATNDIGLVTLPNGRQKAVVVFIADSPADEATREAVIAKISRAISDELAQ